MESKIKKLLKNDKTICIFDVDGVLTPLEFGCYNHYSLNDEEWAKAVLKGDCYQDCRPIKVMQDFIKTLDKRKVYVVTRVMNEMELVQKQNFLKKNYDILPENVFMTLKNEDKLKAIFKIQEKYPQLDSKYFVMIDDTVDVLNHILENSSFSTVHISSFFE